MGMAEFGMYLRERRTCAGLTQRALGECAGIDFTYISKLENDQAPPPSITTLYRLADAVGAPVADMCAAAGRVNRDMTRQELEGYVLELQSQNERLNAALQWYADVNTYDDMAVPGGFRTPDMGKRARSALGHDSMTYATQDTGGGGGCGDEEEGE